MEVFAQPGGDGAQVALFRSGPHVHVLLHGSEHLHAVGAAQGIGGEVAEHAAGPVGVLQHAPAVVRHVHAQVFLVHAVPQPGQLVHLHIALHHQLLDLIADHDVHGIGQLVGLGADQGGLGLVHRRVEHLGGHALQLLREQLLHHRQRRLAEGQAAADQVLIEAALTLVQAHGGAGVQARELQFIPCPQLVQGMAALVDHAVHAGEQIVLIVVGGDAHIPLVEAGGEGMLRLGDGAAAAVDAHHGHQPVGQLPLDVYREAMLQEVRAGGGLFRHRQDHGGQPLPQGGEEEIQRRHGRALLVAVQHHVVGGLLVVLVGGEAAVVVDELLQVGGEEGVVIGFLGLVPDGGGLRLQLLVGGELLQGDTGHVLVILLEQLGLPGHDVRDQVAALQDGLVDFGGLVIHQQLVGDAGQIPHGPAPALVGIGGGGSVAVGVQDAHGVVVGAGGGLIFIQLGNGLFEGHVKSHLSQL